MAFFGLQGMVADARNIHATDPLSGNFRLMKSCFLAFAAGFFALAAFARPCSAAPESIVPGAVWLDDTGKQIQAHGGGVILVDGTYYWYGEDRDPANPKGLRFVSGYSSKDLVHWTHLGQVMSSTIPVVERPKVYYNAKSKLWIMYIHADGTFPGQPGYSIASVAVFVSKSPAGPFVMWRMFRPFGHESRDIGQFIDDDGAAYLIYENRPFGFRIARLTGDYLDLASETVVPQALEGGALAHVGDTYFVVASHLSGWGPNPNVFASAKSVTGPWSKFEDIAPPETKTYQSQSSMLLTVKGTKTTTLIYMGDRWTPSRLWDSRYIWMPLVMEGGKLRLPEPKPWTIDVETGEVTFPAADPAVTAPAPQVASH
jgi:hypothetical protein